jgi:hypothetical protein
LLASRCIHDVVAHKPDKLGNLDIGAADPHAGLKRMASTLCVVDDCPDELMPDAPEETALAVDGVADVVAPDVAVVEVTAAKVVVPAVVVVVLVDGEVVAVATVVVVVGVLPVVSEGLLPLGTC